MVETTDGPVQIEFVRANALGVADHRVTIKPGVEVLNPVRVIPNGDGSEAMFTLFQPPGMSDEKFDADSALVEEDLKALKHILENKRDVELRQPT